ncbi:hypothetical protein M4I32_01660 [Microbacterium sp. LRZ72]|uniref:hypothetical protein n=1 Tax=Microbacterium sp. LRZ72 TaxID=2942481 RepID=UPI0029A2990E|nr:hypothetical protein [Microbacterium sp. LRZ72]MDX2375505.1 hypothetical protein [Microbacterium sp. LRZ72]
MQMGTRWTAGAQPPASVPEDLWGPIAHVEALSVGTAGPAPRWTLTWLEGRPVAELDTGVIVTKDRTGAVVVQHDPDDTFA